MQTLRPKRGTAPWADPSARPLLRIEDLSKRFGTNAAVDKLSLDVYQGELLALLGPPGCGKTTLMRMIAGFERPETGRILLDGVDLVGVPPHRRPLNMMFGNDTLFPHLTVEDNVAFGLKQEGLPRNEIDQRSAEMLAMVKLEGFGRRKPHELSAAQRWRAALARALVKRPRLLLLDEPLAALDDNERDAARAELMDLQQRLQQTFVIATRDRGEAMTIADRIGAMDRGWLKQVAPPADIYERPNSRWVAEFVGDANLFEGRVGDDGASVEGTAAGTLRVAAKIDAAPGANVWVAVRPEKLRVTNEQGAPQPDNCVAVTIADIAYRGDLTVYKLLTADGAMLKAVIGHSAAAAERPIDWDDRAWASFAPDAAIVLTR
jgi:putrescine transport system ATP-binding protein